jgi:hypothetical protein
VLMSSARILAFDPSSSRIGYAAIDGRQALVEAGLIRPHRTRDLPNERIEAMSADALAVIAQFPTDTAVVVEDTEGKVGGRHKGGGAGLATYGKAVGWLIGSIKATGRTVYLVKENVWTRGQPKADRALRVSSLYPQYDSKLDPGMDVADAIGLAVWWANDRRAKQAVG